MTVVNTTEESAISRRPASTVATTTSATEAPPPTAHVNLISPTTRVWADVVRIFVIPYNNLVTTKSCGILNDDIPNR